MSEELSELAILLDAAPRTLHINGKDIEVKVFKVGSWVELTKHINKLRHVFYGLTEDVNKDSLLDVIGNSLGDVLDLVAFMTKTDRAWVDELDLDQTIEILVSFVSVNKSFFIQKVVPLIQGLSSARKSSESK